MFRCLSVVLVAAWLGADIRAEDGKFFPLDHRQPLGVAGRWSLLSRPSLAGHMQHVRVDVEGGATVSYYQGSPQNEQQTAAPTQARMQVGRVYRLKLSNLQGKPGVELYPTLEILDRLHPPEGMAAQFPIPVQITAEEIEIASREELVTKVVYLEQPQFATPLETTADRMLTDDLPLSKNLLEVADLRGRPLLIVRIGGRIPDPNATTDEFYSSSPLVITEVQPELPDVTPEP